MVDRQYAEAHLAALYDPLCGREQRDDFQFYLPLIMRAASVLDVGCGTGALLHLAREAGHTGRLVGLDPGGGMLRVARTRSDIEWRLGDLSTDRWCEAFDLVVMTGHAFQVLIEDTEIRAALNALRIALKPGAMLAFETRNPLAREWERWAPESGVDFVAPDGASARFEVSVENVLGDVVAFTTRYEHDAWDTPESSRSLLRFLGKDDLASFLTLAGFAITEQFGDWDGSRLSPASPEIITIARTT